VISGPNASSEFHRLSRTLEKTRSQYKFYNLMALTTSSDSSARVFERLVEWKMREEKTLAARLSALKSG